MLAASSWGEMGNLTSAYKLAKVLQASFSDVPVCVRPFEALCPAFARAGEEMRRIASSSTSPQERRRRYLDLQAQLQQSFPVDFEDSGNAPDGVDLASIAQAIGHYRPRLLVGTKGLISRIACTAIRHHGDEKTPVVNYTTNDGLLELPVHHCPGADVHIVQSEMGRRLLAEVASIPPDRVRVAGRLVGAVDALAPPDDDPRPFIGVFANRSSVDEYAKIFAHLYGLGALVRGRGIVAGSPALLAQAQAAAPSNWTVTGAMEAGSYLQELAALARHRRCLMICKAGPNTVLETLMAGVPILALRSGLPMEDWVSAMLERNALGHSFDSAGDLLAELDAWLASPEILEGARATIRAFVRKEMDNSATAARLIDIFGTFLTAQTSVAAEEMKARAHRSARSRVS